MKEFFEFDRRKKTDVVTQVVEQFIAYVEDYKLISGTPLPDLKEVKKELGLSDDEIDRILSVLLAKNYLRQDQDKHYFVNLANYHYDFIVNVSPAYREIINSGKTPKVFTIAKRVCEVDESMMRTFQGLTLGKKVVHYQRYFTADNVPMFYIEFCLSFDQLPQSMQVFNDDQPHLDLMMQKFPQQYKFHVREVKIVTLPEPIQKLFKVKDKQTIATLGHYRFFNAKGEVVETGFAYMTDLTDFNTTTVDLTEILL